MAKTFTLPPRCTLGSSKSFESDSDSSTYHCHYCSTQNSHAGDSSHPLFECEICSKKFRQLSTYTRHKKMHCNPEEKVFICCRLCTHTCESELSMKFHVTEVHAPKKDFYKSNKTYNSKEEVDNNFRNNQYTCKTCLKSFKKKCHLFNHIRCHVPKLVSIFVSFIKYSGYIKCRKFRKITFQQPSQKEECSKDVVLGEPNVKNGFQKSSGILVNFWPRVVLSSHLNILLSRRNE
uniref:C2H2-type domain-containing protein n=1 Tax=Daphnia galeata TaxID=27404 RepID=A0A8J2W7B4_9CRUS|nr:unnamed protein product [Daphnia galeata]